MKYRRSIVETHPKIAAQWHPIKNGNRTPDEFTSGSHYRAWWKCPVAKDHEWQVTIKSRKIRGCPCCAGKAVVTSNCLATTHPKIAAQWHPTKNDRTPDEFTAGSKYKAWWRCPVVKDHEWQATIVHRKMGRNCPYCYNERRWGDGGSTWTGYGEISGTYWASIKCHARQRDDGKFNITKQYAWNLFIEQGRKCSLTGQLLTMLDHRGKTASLDRIDSKLGYIRGNVQWIHKDLQTMKWDLPEDRFVRLCDEVSRYARLKRRGRTYGVTKSFRVVKGQQS